MKSGIYLNKSWDSESYTGFLLVSDPPSMELYNQEYTTSYTMIHTMSMIIMIFGKGVQLVSDPLDYADVYTIYCNCNYWFYSTNIVIRRYTELSVYVRMHDYKMAGVCTES